MRIASRINVSENIPVASNKNVLMTVVLSIGGIKTREIGVMKYEAEHGNHLLMQKISLYKEVANPVIDLVVKAEHQGQLTQDDLQKFDRSTMGEHRSDLLRGTLDLLILKTLTLESMHGLGISRRLEQFTISRVLEAT